MANKVFANGREIACKAGAGKSIAAFPDVCLSPPSPPAGPIPLPYPVTAMASDTTKGSKKVKISKKEVILKNKSCIKKCNGDQAATKSFGMGVVTHALSGKVYFSAWSMDVKYEGKNVTRHLDITTHNHNSMPGDTPPWPFMDSMAVSKDPCADDKKKEEEACKEEGVAPYGANDPCPKDTTYYRSKKNAPKAMDQAEGVKKSKCLKARKCKLQPYTKTKKGKGGCCPGQTGHHLIPKSSFKTVAGYSKHKAPCICVEGAGHSIGTHGKMHAIQSYSADRMVNPTLNKVTKAASGALVSVFPTSGCDRKCIEAQLNQYHQEEVGASPDTPIKPPATSIPSTETVREVIQKVAAGAA